MKIFMSEITFGYEVFGYDCTTDFPNTKNTGKICNIFLQRIIKNLAGIRFVVYRV